MYTLSFSIKKFIFSLFCVFSLSIAGISQRQDLSYFLPSDNYDSSIPTPESFLGHQVGEWHVSHDKLYYYMAKLAEVSDRIKIKEYARSHEHRPLVYLTITSPENHQTLTNIKEQHRKLVDPSVSNDLDISQLPIVIYQGYSIHGNEPSGSNAALLYAYYLAASKNPELIEKLENTIILLDPSYNPDGLHRFSSWVNTHKNKQLTNHPSDREYNETWPRGRTNHYWFDLNRDWLPLTHPESQGRVKIFHEWKPEILTDHHEMGTNSTFFFQPGVPDRTNPNTPQKNQILTEEIARFHVAILDDLKSLYYTKYGFDDYYYGKGSTYPDINGGVGILFEQASSRGHLQRSVNGDLSFPFTIRNQVATSLSTLNAATGLHNEMLEYKRMFFQDAWKAAENGSIKGHLVSDHDVAKMKILSELLSAHDIEYYRLAEDTKVGETTYPVQNSIYIPRLQYQSKLVTTLFENVTEFKDSIFYDVSTWTLPLAFDVNHTEVDHRILGKINVGERASSADFTLAPSFSMSANTYALIMPWENYHAPAALYAIQKLGLRTKLSNEPIIIQSGDEVMSFKRGSIIIPLQNQSLDPDEIGSGIKEISETFSIALYSLETGYGENNVTLGHPNISALTQPKVLLLIGDGVSSYDAGEVWHHFDTRLQIPITKMDTDDFNGRALQDFNTLVLANGNYSFSESETKDLSQWVSNGGKLILLTGAVNWAVRSKLISLERQSKDQDMSPTGTYAKASAERGARVLGGAIFDTKADLTHPLLYGYENESIPVFRRGTTFYKPPSNIYSSPLKYPSKARISGYIPKGAEDSAEGAAAVSVHRKGRGRIISIMDNPIFRGYWRGGNRLFNNAIFFGDIISGSTSSNE